MFCVLTVCMCVCKPGLTHSFFFTVNNTEFARGLKLKIAIYVCGEVVNEINKPKIEFE